MRLLLIGAPGSGKGTQAANLAAHYGLVHISSGDLLRRHVTNRSRIGRAAATYIDRGDLVPDVIVMDILRKPVETASRRSGYILDGFPRTVAQAEAAYLIAEPLQAAVRIAIHLDVTRDELARRLHARRIRTSRSDDTGDVIAHRLDVYDEATAPLIDYYRRRETVITVNGDQPINHITRELVTELDRTCHALDIPIPTTAHHAR